MFASRLIKPNLHRLLPPGNWSAVRRVAHRRARHGYQWHPFHRHSESV